MRWHQRLLSIVVSVLFLGTLLFALQAVVLYGVYALDSSFEADTLGPIWLTIYGPGLSAARALYAWQTGFEPSAAFDSLVTAFEAGGGSRALLWLASGVYAVAAGFVYGVYRGRNRDL